MNRTTNSSKKFRSSKILMFAAATALGCSMLRAAPPLINPTGGASAALKGEGLDSLDDRALGAELSGRGIGNLLDRYFTVNRIPEYDQRAIKTVGASRELTGKNAVNIPYGEKLRRVREVASGIDAVLPTLKDPRQMMITAAIIIEFGVNADVNSIQYWGEDPVTQAQLKPMASAVVKLLDTASKTAQQQADKLATILKGGNDPNADKWEKLDELAHTADYNKNMSVYFEALATNPKDPARKTMSDAATTVLKDFDTPDSGVQPRIRNILAKLSMVTGDFAAAKKQFSSLYADKVEIKPDPNPFEVYEARYFSVVTDVLNKDLAAAQADKTALDAYQKQQLPGLMAGLKMDAKAIAETNKGMDSAGEMLQWRVHVLEGDLAKPGSPEKAKADTAAETILNNLRVSRPDLAPRIDQQLVNRMPANRVIDDKTTASLLQALLKRGLNESYRGEPPDNPVFTDQQRQIINKGIEAGQVIIHRTDRQGLPPQSAVDAQLSVALLYDKLGRTVEAAGSYVDYSIAAYKLDPKKATEAFDRAGYLVFEMKRKQPAAPAGFAELYDKFLPIAIEPPYNHKEFATIWGDKLRETKKYADALRFYRMVAKGSPAYFNAVYKQMLVTRDMLKDDHTPAERKLIVADLAKAADEISKMGEASKEVRERDKGARAALLLANIALAEDKDLKRTAALLEGFDQRVKGLPKEDEEDLLHGALVVRVNVKLSLKQTNEAVQDVLKILDSAKSDDDFNLARRVVAQLDEDFNQATMAHDVAKQRSLTLDTASLTHYVVDWFKKSVQKTPTDAKLSKYYYQYSFYDATACRNAAALVEDPAEKKKQLELARVKYQLLQTPDMHTRFTAMPEIAERIKTGSVEAADPDPNVETNLAPTSFELGNYDEAKKLLEPLLARKKLGGPQVEVIDPDTKEPKLQPNGLYWEAWYKFIKSDYEVSKTDPKAMDTVGKILKNMLIAGGIPDLWKERFEALHQAIIPDFNPNAPIVRKPGPAAAPTGPAKPVAAK